MSSSISPPSTIVSLSSASTVVLISRLLVTTSDKRIGGDGGERRQHQVGDFLFDVETHRRAVVNVRRHRQRDADVFALDRRERVVGAVGIRRERTGSERHFLTDEDFRFFVVERQDARRRQQVGVRCSSRSPAARRRTKNRSCSSFATAMPGEVNALAAAIGTTGIGLPVGIGRSRQAP